ncbi:unnamed protein product [Trichobilharzia szidati]|nr:unnamed protein product [Trichobilharzia szidati]
MKVEIRDGCDESENKLWPSESMDESYNITIHDREISITSNEIWGVLHALETILQLVYTNEVGENLIFKGRIEDDPEFSYRGVLVNTGSNFIPMEYLFKTIDAMAMVKMNVFHWRVTDNQSFPFVSSTYPELSNKGAFHPQSCTYDEEEVSDLLEYARLRGVRVIPEFNTPDHTLSWGNGYPDILTKCYKDSEPDGNLGPLNPTDPETFNFLENFYKEIITRFTDSYLYLGGDVADLSCWKSNPEIVQFMDSMQFGDDYGKLVTYYMDRLVEIIANVTPSESTITPILHESVFTNGFRSNTNAIIHVCSSLDWKTVTQLATTEGFNVIVTGAWQLDVWLSADDWKQHYEQDIRDFGGTDEQSQLVIGGLAAIWGRLVDETNLISLSWPRAAAAAERLWSRNPEDIEKFGERLSELHCRMAKNNIQGYPVNGPGFCPP